MGYVVSTWPRLSQTLEAMASGLPVVSTPVSGIPELIETGRDGLLVPEKNPVQLAGALDRLLENPQLRDGLALAARNKIQERFTIDRSCEQLMALFSPQPVIPGNGMERRN